MAQKRRAPLAGRPSLQENNSLKSYFFFFLAAAFFFGAAFFAADFFVAVFFFVAIVFSSLFEVEHDREKRRLLFVLPNHNYILERDSFDCQKNITKQRVSTLAGGDPFIKLSSSLSSPSSHHASCAR